MKEQLELDKNGNARRKPDAISYQKKQVRRREFEMVLNGPLSNLKKDQRVRVRATDSICIRGATRDFRLWPESHASYYWTTVYDKELRDKKFVLRVVPRKRNPEE